MIRQVGRYEISVGRFSRRDRVGVTWQKLGGGWHIGVALFPRVGCHLAWWRLR